MPFFIALRPRKLFPKRAPLNPTHTRITNHHDAKGKTLEHVPRQRRHFPSSYVCVPPSPSDVCQRTEQIEAATCPQ
ncbi:hypothetical protein WN55_11180 [Dufourea novaeangliae]|uniref:Uncharacterized protein n=1 Tax=Dufourea novaeangliae TaxID=178035 RepID=A0A154PCC7_DUFNO|nr:hypothetical protein WN55_11180 [Dufourea novaeangliae]